MMLMKRKKFPDAIFKCFFFSPVQFVFILDRKEAQNVEACVRVCSGVSLEVLAVKLMMTTDLSAFRTQSPR